MFVAAVAQAPAAAAPPPAAAAPLAPSNRPAEAAPRGRPSGGGKANPPAPGPVTAAKPPAAPSAAKPAAPVKPPSGEGRLPIQSARACARVWGTGVGGRGCMCGADASSSPPSSLRWALPAITCIMQVHAWWRQQYHQQQQQQLGRRGLGQAAAPSRVSGHRGMGRLHELHIHTHHRPSFRAARLAWRPHPGASSRTLSCVRVPACRMRRCCACRQRRREWGEAARF